MCRKKAKTVDWKEFSEMLKSLRLMGGGRGPGKIDSHKARVCEHWIASLHDDLHDVYIVYVSACTQMGHFIP